MNIRIRASIKLDYFNIELNRRYFLQRAFYLNKNLLFYLFALHNKPCNFLEATFFVDKFMNEM